MLAFFIFWIEIISWLLALLKVLNAILELYLLQFNKITNTLLKKIGALSWHDVFMQISVRWDEFSYKEYYQK